MVDNDHLPEVIPPRSVVRLSYADAETPEWLNDVGREFRVGYYSPKDGLGTIWLVNAKGRYEQTTDRSLIGRYFEVLSLSDETDFYGENRPELPPLTQVRRSP